jgi:hypothetical protein
VRFWMLALVWFGGCELAVDEDAEVFCSCGCTCEDGSDESVDKSCAASDEDICCEDACGLICDEAGAGDVDSYDGTCEDVEEDA